METTRVFAAVWLCVAASAGAARGAEPMAPPDYGVLDRAIEAPCDAKARSEPGSYVVGLGDLNRDGAADVVVDMSLVCAPDSVPSSQFCGSAGCRTSLWLSGQSGYTKIFEDNAYRIGFVELDGQPAVEIVLSGAACGKAGAVDCRQLRVLKGGTLEQRHTIVAEGEMEEDGEGLGTAPIPPADPPSSTGAPDTPPPQGSPPPP